MGYKQRGNFTEDCPTLKMRGRPSSLVEMKRKSRLRGLWSAPTLQRWCTACQKDPGRRYIAPIHKWPICPISAFCSKFYPWNIDHMPMVKFLAGLDLEPICLFLDGLSKTFWLHFAPRRVVLSSVLTASTVGIDSSLDACVPGGIYSATIDSGAPALVASFVLLLFHHFDLKTNNMDGCV